ncbi:MAG: GGDEF domain-containing protein [Proteobacteria bacterium]|nr:MAG: GGDEF domain-containing protein [Pseudomonadota bacterium]
METIVTWIESITNIINVSLAVVILSLGLRILKSMRFSLQRGSVRLFIAAALLFAAKEVVASIERGMQAMWLHDIHEVLETGFICCLCYAMYLIVQSEKLEISNLHEQVSLDALTGLMNLRAFSKLGALRVKHARENGLPLALFMIDLDGFKQYNDTYGHEAGNAALKAVAAALRHSARENDLIARYGGEEFVLLLFTSPDAALSAAERVRRTIESECSPDGNLALYRSITASIGVARLEPSILSLTELIETADQQLYRAKHNGRNQASMANEDA